MTGPLVEASGLWKSYGGGPGGPIDVLRGVSLCLHPAETAAVVGPSGSGKTTLLQLLGALDRPDAGSLRFGGLDLGELGDAALAAFRNREVGFVFQLHHLLPQCTALENVLVPTLLARRPGAEERARRLLARVGLADRLGHRPGQLSGGERQRVAVARALVNGPRLVLADEPTGSLDAASAEDLGDVLLELNREEGAALLVATHSRALAGRLGRVLELRGGLLSEAAG